MRLITSYLTIIFLTITAPFQLLLASLPGRQQIATNWMFNLLGNVLVFPAVLAVFYFVALLLGRDFATTTTSGLLGNPDLLVNTALAQEKITVVGNSAFPLLGGLDLTVLQVLLAFGSLMALPSIPDLVVKAVGKMGQAGQVVSNEIMGAYRTGQSYSNQSQGALSSNFKDYEEVSYRLPGDRNVILPPEQKFGENIASEDIVETTMGLLDAFPNDLRAEIIEKEWIPMGLNSHFPETLANIPREGDYNREFYGPAMHHVRPRTKVVRPLTGKY